MAFYRSRHYDDFRTGHVDHATGRYVFDRGSVLDNPRNNSGGAGAEQGPSGQANRDAASPAVEQPPAVIHIQGQENNSDVQAVPEEPTSPVTASSSDEPQTPTAPESDVGSPFATSALMSQIEGMDCYGDEREALSDFERFYNNPQLSDVTLVVGDDSYYAHKLVLVKSSEVFERMLSQQWSGDNKKPNVLKLKNEVELVEDRLCIRVFPAFLRFLYTSHIVLHYDNTLPILILADKYNVISLRKVCLNYAMDHIIPNLPQKEVFHVWYQYGTKCFHQGLIQACIAGLAQNFQEIITAAEWEREWLSVDRDQLAELLKSSDLYVSNEFEVWQALLKWIQAGSHPERQGAALEKNLNILVPLVRFPLMVPDELTAVEKSSLVEKCPKIFNPQLMLAYKFNSLPLQTRSTMKDFSGQQFMLRNYTDLRWDKRLEIPNFSSIPRFTEVTLHLTSRASAFPQQSWDWELKLHPKGYSQNADEFRAILVASNLILDQTRAIEYLLSIVDDRRIIKSVSGRKNFSKTRYSVDMEVEKKISLEELLTENSPLICDDALYLQLTLRPID